MEDDAPLLLTATATRRSRASDLSWSVHSSLIQMLPVHDFESEGGSSEVDVDGGVMVMALEEEILCMCVSV